jgi:hypothetical protein
VIDLDRITHPLRLAAGSHQPGSGKGCAMNVISYINGDAKITDYPKCSARPLARLVRPLNDRLGRRDRFLSPEDSVLMLDLAWRTVGTADTAPEIVWRWLFDLLVDPDHGVVHHVEPYAAAAIRSGAALCERESNGETVPFGEWPDGLRNRFDLHSLRTYTTSRADVDIAVDHYVNVLGSRSRALLNPGDHIEFVRWAIDHWRDLAGLDTEPEIGYDAINHALGVMTP